MPKLSDAARATAPDGAVWRTCSGCDHLTALPPTVQALTALRAHLAEHFDDAPESLIFTGGKGAALRSGNFGRAVNWPATVQKLGLPAGFHFP
jgi:hypothetical protein